MFVYLFSEEMRAHSFKHPCQLKQSELHSQMLGNDAPDTFVDTCKSGCGISPVASSQLVKGTLLFFQPATFATKISLSAIGLPLVLSLGWAVVQVCGNDSLVTLNWRLGLHHLGSLLFQFGIMNLYSLGWPHGLIAVLGVLLGSSSWSPLPLEAPAQPFIVGCHTPQWTGTQLAHGHRRSLHFHHYWVISAVSAQ